MNTQGDISRRKFLETGAAGAAATLFPAVIPSSALGRDGHIAPSNRIVMATVGTGRQGTSNMKSFLNNREVQMVAVCDVDRKHRKAAKEIVDRKYQNSDCVAYSDFREATRRTDIDAVCIATPDHWHTIPALDAARHGKDMYVQKPLTLTIHEGRVLADTVQRYGRILQTGSQQRSSRQFRMACELVRNGRIGKIHTVEVTIPGNNRTCEPTWQPEPVPDELDYDFWLGPAPWAPYHHQRCHYQFRFLLDYSGGQVTNWGAHHNDIAQWGLGMDASGPIEVFGDGEFPKTGLFTTATRVYFECKYANGARLICKTQKPSGTRFIGTDGEIFVSRGKLEATPESVLREQIGPDEIHLYKSNSHKENFLECVKSRRKPICDEEVGHRSASICHLGNIAMLLNKRIKWDPIREVSDDPEANRMLSRPKRGPWQV